MSTDTDTLAALDPAVERAARAAGYSRRQVKAGYAASRALVLACAAEVEDRPSRFLLDIAATTLDRLAKAGVGHAEAPGFIVDVLRLPAPVPAVWQPADTQPIDTQPADLHSTDTRPMDTQPDAELAADADPAAHYLAPGERREVRLRGAYDDLTDRPRRYPALEARFGEGVQIEYVRTADDGSVALGLVHGLPSRRPQAKTPTGMPAQISNRDGEQFAALAHERGLELVEFDAASRRVVMAEVAPFVADLRHRIAARLTPRPEWQVGDVSVLWRVGEDGAGELAEVRVTGIAPAADAAKTEALWLQIAQTSIGHAGWRCVVDHQTNSVVMRSGAASRIPAKAGYSWSVVDAGAWCDMAFGTDGYRRPVTADLSANPHALVVGKTGSGKSILLQSFMYDALVHGWELAIVDPTKRGLDFRWARPYVREGGWGCANYADALAVLRAAYDEGQRRLNILDSLDLPKWTALSAEDRARHGITPLLVVADEGTSLAKLEAVLRVLPPDDPDRIAAEELNADKQRIMSIIGKIARELRFVGVHLVFGTQRFSVQDIGDGAGGLRENLGVRILLGRASSTALGMAFADPADALAAYEEAHGVTATTDGDAAPEKRPGRGIVEIDGMATTAFQGWYAETEELVKRLISRGVPVHDGDGRPHLVESSGRAFEVIETTTIIDANDADRVVSDTSVSFSLTDLESMLDSDSDSDSTDAAPLAAGVDTVVTDRFEPSDTDNTDDGFGDSEPVRPARQTRPQPDDDDDGWG